MIAGIDVAKKDRTEGRTDVKVEIVKKIPFNRHFEKYFTVHCSALDIMGQSKIFVLDSNPIPEQNNRSFKS